MEEDLALVPAPPPAPTEDILTDTYTCTLAFFMVVTFVIILTRFRLWHTNKILKKIPKLAKTLVHTLITQGIGFVGAAAHYQIENELYLLWVVIIFIAYDNVFTISYYSLLEAASERSSREYVFLFNCIFIGYFIFIHKDKPCFALLLALWLLVVARFLLRIASFGRGDKAYGLENVNRVSNYMKNEHKLTKSSDAIDPMSMQGYKYLVMGEEKANLRTEAPEYTTMVELKADVVTVERVWSCKEGLLHPDVDKDGALKDICLSFALFKLLRRRYFGYPAAEAEQPKAKKFVFEGLLSANSNGKDQGEVDKERVFRVIKMEIGFLRDFFFTRYPVVFAFGFPVLNLVLLGGVLGVTIWIAKFNASLYSKHIVVKNDYYITNLLLILILVMKIFEALTYVFCDWTKVITVCRNVRSNFSQVANQLDSSDAGLQKRHIGLISYKVLAIFCKPRFSLSAKNTLGQYSLLRNCTKTSVSRSFVRCCRICTCKKAPQLELKKSKSVVLTENVKNVIFDTLVRSRGTAMPLQRYQQDLQWTLNLATPVHTIIVWHIATSLCAIHPVKKGGGKESINSDLMVATHLSNYCAYLVAFHPDLLPFTTTNSVKYVLCKILEETAEFFDGEHKMEKMYKKMMKCEDGGEKIIDQGSKLARYMINNINDENQRWKMMAEFWSEYILFLAPSGSTRAHIEQLECGSEFITHLWALLYHGGITDTSSAEYHSVV